ncbi:MAG: hypothetical protein LC731_01325 [Acidobacteria bacterium]|nr:hypothetical protein [Acidobacteriota bacterium]
MMTEIERLIDERGVSVVIDEIADVLMKKMNRRPVTGDEWHNLGNDLQAKAFRARSIEKMEPKVDSDAVS